MRVLLTGAAGFVGAHVHRALVAAGHRVVAVDSLAAAVHGANPEPPEGISVVDIRDPDALEPLLRGVDVVCHLAAAVPPVSTGPHDVVGAPGLVVPAGAGAAESGAVFSSSGPAGSETGGAQQRSSATGVRTADGSGSVAEAGAGPAEAYPGTDGEVSASDSSELLFGDDERRGGAVAPGSGANGRPAGEPRRGDRQTEPTWRGDGGAHRSPGPAAAPAAPTLQTAPMFAAHNDFGTAVLLAAMERAGTRRLVLASSVSVYGEGRYRAPHGGPFFPGLRRRADLDRGRFDHRAPRTGEILTWEPVAEDAPLRPRTAYAASKLAQENYALAWGVATGGAVTALRYHHVYGDPAGDCADPAAHTGVAARFRADLAAGRAPVVFEDGGQVRDLVHIHDAAAAAVAAVERPLPGFVPLNIASGHPVTLWEVASIMARARGGPEPVVSGQYRASDVRHLVAHPERARHALDFAARIAPARGLAEYATSAAVARR
ncbi:NAD-dependent epimerase/dehydratase family protein [Nocardia sp. BMG51109]|uniref:NAD-dependent epimerase/dehydratase family protein n=1 Tax=Nocardia sp. BMG51109 TaxID=1056816 RepID=UPI000463EA2D